MQIFFIENDKKNINTNKFKAEYIKNHIDNDDVAVLIDDDVRILCEAQIVLKDRIIPVHVTSLLL